MMAGWQNNKLPRDSLESQGSFQRLFGEVYEYSPWIAEGAWNALQGHAAPSFADLAAEMAKAVRHAAVHAQSALLQAHPELAGKLALAGDLTDNSLAEQAGAGLDQCSPEELEEISDLNARYHFRFGFPFIIAVKDLSRTEIIAAMRRRLDQSPESERAEALRQVNRIAEIRLERIATCEEA